MISHPTAPGSLPTGWRPATTGCTCCTVLPSKGSAVPTWRASSGRCSGRSATSSRWTATCRTRCRRCRRCSRRHRRLISRGGCAYARLVLGVPVHDLTGGFKCFRRWVLESLDLSHVRAGGYAFQIELTYRALRMGGRVVELPITFTDRAYGESKMSRAIVLEAVREVPALRLRAVRGRLLERPGGEPRVSLIP